MALPPIPSNIVQWIKQAAAGTGLPEPVVAAQNYVESGYGSNMGPSSAGALGPWQFEPGTWSSYSSMPFSDATNWADSTAAYTKFMSQLLKQENGNVRDALAAYNAGPGNIGAGYGYADQILSLASESQNLQIGSPNDSAGGSSTASIGGGLFSWPGDIVGFFKDAKTFVDALMWIVNPASWLRIGSFMIAGILLLMALWIFTKVGSDQPILRMPSTIPVPV